MKTTTFRLLNLAALLGCGCVSFAQVADVAVPKQRDNLVEAAEKLLAAREKPVAVVTAYANPFLWKQAEVADAPVMETAPTNAPSIVGEELLARLAARIPVTGVAFLGGEGVLLLGQKKLKVGDSITISFEGQDYELSIAGISSASFTVKRGSLLHTRPTQLASSTTVNNRP